MKSIKYIYQNYYNCYDDEILVKSYVNEFNAYEFLTQSKIVYKYIVNNNIISKNNFNDVLKDIFDYPKTFKLIDDNGFTKRQIKEFDRLKNKCLNNDKIKPICLGDNLWQTYNEFDNENDFLTNTLGALEDYARIGFYYPFEIGSDHSHHHNIEAVFSEAYDYPESFYIKDDDKEYYTNSELEFIYKIKEVALKNGLKDIRKCIKNAGKENKKEYDKRGLRNFKWNYTPKIIKVTKESLKMFNEVFNIYDKSIVNKESNHEGYIYYSDEKRNIYYYAYYNVISKTEIEIKLEKDKYCDESLNINNFLTALKKFLNDIKIIRISIPENININFGKLIYLKEKEDYIFKNEEK